MTVVTVQHTYRTFITFNDMPLPKFPSLANKIYSFVLSLEVAKGLGLLLPLTTATLARNPPS